MWRNWIFEQAIFAMPISDYTRAFFFARRDRVTHSKVEKRNAAAIAISKLSPSTNDIMAA
jgi:hypothetical protein